MAAVACEVSRRAVDMTLVALTKEREMEEARA